MDEKTQGLVIKLIDYKDADKLASIFTFDYGVVTAKFVGVKKEKAKLKAIAQPFTFADFNLTKRGEHKIVSGADAIDSFYAIMNNYNKTICGFIVLDIIKSILPEEKPEQDLFLLTISSLKNIEKNNEFIATIDFILKFLNFSGFQLNFPEIDYAYFDKSSGEFSSIRTNNSMQVDKTVYHTLKLINSNDLVAEDEKTLKQCLRFLNNLILINFNSEIKSFEFI